VTRRLHGDVRTMPKSTFRAKIVAPPNQRGRTLSN
jgi:hypothetical protein